MLILRLRLACIHPPPLVRRAVNITNEREARDTSVRLELKCD